ncbi:uncharacterized protein K460DRAFT_296241 [Cucurbitaria berberidis CBS 394.84]|uniref:Uncharacterized protein n=1 Tax=Cucurbitaria berberidis CBS 394.84 TaxID=1168544 RepID=A0A9P4G6U4_9PLEO|nr:uncharacterized protein K460DRAFT_296241 [Cucurbitaria berberidis CBS 394.84]KAF1840108.1 hypothetical protein K460DRAFT_296241 [Cucurbitaria berberidis CBS 394.84]
MYTQATIPTQIRLCVECKVWVSTDLEWIKHNELHAHNPSIVYGPVIAEGILAAPRRCPYCTKQGMYLQIENHSKYVEHIEEHVRQQMADNSDSELHCPHYSCAHMGFDKRRLLSHLDKVHGISF